MMKLDPQITGNVGLYYCCYRLSLLGWNVMPTARNARGVDIIDYDRSATNFWVIVSEVSTSPSAFVLLPSEIKKRAHRGEKDGRVSFWLQPADYDQEAFREAWDRIGNG
jgi:hypothetical protein